jgi:hypothetical protein
MIIIGAVACAILTEQNHETDQQLVWQAGKTVALPPAM